LVAYCEESTEGFYLNTLSAVDVATGWVERQGVWGKGQDRVGAAIHHIGQPAIELVKISILELYLALILYLIYGPAGRENQCFHKLYGGWRQTI